MAITWQKRAVVIDTHIIEFNQQKDTKSFSFRKRLG
jgi:hypothetical protein